MDNLATKKGKPILQSSQQKLKTKKAASQGFNPLKFARDNILISCLLIVFLAALVLKYYEDDHSQKSGFIDFGQDIYSLFGISKHAQEAEIKSKYRELSLKWHPDKNPDCADCADKFMKLKEGYKILLNPKLRRIYDRTNGFTIDIIASETTELTSLNYKQLLRGTNKVWVVQVYSDDWDSCKGFARHWEDAANKYGDVANFGRINVLLDPKVAGKLPIKVQLYPAVLLLFPGGGFDLFPQSALANVGEFSRYFEKVYPSALVHYEDYETFKAKHDFKAPSLLFYTVGSVPIVAKYLSLRLQHQLKCAVIVGEESAISDELYLKDVISADTEGHNFLQHIVSTSLLGESNITLTLYNEHGSPVALTRQPSTLDPRALVDAALLSSQLVPEPVELVQETFDNVATKYSSGKRLDKFAVIIGNGYPRELLRYDRILEKLVSYNTFSSVASVYYKDPQESKKKTDEDKEESKEETQEGEEAAEKDTDVKPEVKIPNASAMVQFVRVSSTNSTFGLRKFQCAGDKCLVILDLKRKKFCQVPNPHVDVKVDYPCEVDKNNTLEWLGNLIEGDFDTFQWYEFPKQCKEDIKSKCLSSAKSWLSLFDYWSRAAIF